MSEETRTRQLTSMYDEVTEASIRVLVQQAIHHSLKTPCHLLLPGGTSGESSEMKINSN